MHVALLGLLLWMQDGSIVGMAKLPGRFASGGGHAPAVAALKAEAAKGTAIAMHDLGVAYDGGIGVARDEEKAADWYRRSYEAGDAAAEADLGQDILLGVGLKSDTAAGLQHLEHAAAAGVGGADFILGNVYMHGNADIRRDVSKARHYFEEGAQRGDPESEAQIGWMYSAGSVVARDDKKALRWNRAAAAQGDAVAEHGLGVQYLLGNGVSRDLEQAEHWFQLSASAGHAHAAYNLASLYAGLIKGWPHPHNWPLAAKYFDEAARQGLYDAQCYLGQLYADGVGVPKDEVQGLSWMISSLEGSNRCSAKATALEGRLTSAERQAAAERAAHFVPAPHLFTYGRRADH